MTLELAALVYLLGLCTRPLIRFAVALFRFAGAGSDALPDTAERRRMLFTRDHSMF